MTGSSRTAPRPSGADRDPAASWEPVPAGQAAAGVGDHGGTAGHRGRAGADEELGRAARMAGGGGVVSAGPAAAGTANGIMFTARLFTPERVNSTMSTARIRNTRA